MPEYTYICGDCDDGFSIFASLSEYDRLSNSNLVQCPNCKTNNVTRDILTDCSTISGSVKKADNELKTVGDLANRNRDRLSEDHKKELYDKHNAYKEETPQKELPKGMSRMKKPTKKIKWR